MPFPAARAAISRRSLMSTLPVAAPRGLSGPRVCASNRIAMPDDRRAAPPICKAAVEIQVTLVPGALR